MPLIRPQRALHLISKMEKNLIKFINEAKRIDRLLEENWQLRLQPPSNGYEMDWQSCINEIGPLLVTQLIGFHCTRLAPFEIEDIHQNGLVPLSSELIQRKLKRQLKSQLLISS